MSSQTLLPPNATLLERSTEAATSRLGDVGVPIADMWNPQAIPENALPWLAWALSADEWDGQWPESVKRQTVSSSPQIHRLKGTVGAVRRALNDLGVSIDLLEWWQTGGSPYTAELVAFASQNLDSTGTTLLTPQLQQQIVNAVERTKPIRAHIDLIVGVGMRDEMWLANAVSTLSCQRQTQTITQDQVVLTGNLMLSGSAIHPSKTVERRTVHVFETVPVFAGVVARAGISSSTLINRITIGMF